VQLFILVEILLWLIWQERRRKPKATPHEPPPLLGSVTAPPATAEPQSAAVTPPAAPGSVTAPPVDQWLTLPAKEALALQKPLPDGALRIVATGEKEDGLAA
jgi:hypothetical protein